MVNYFAEDFTIKDRSYIYTSKLKSARAQARAYSSTGRLVVLWIQYYVLVLAWAKEYSSKKC